MRSVRAAAGPTRSPDCRAARSEPRARRRAPARDACSRSLRRRSRAPPATAAARQSRVPGWRSRQSLRHAQQSAAGAWTSLELGGTRARLAPDELQARPRRGRQQRQTPERRVDLRLALHEALHRAVLEGMKRDHRQPPAGRESLERPCETALELPELVVDEHAQRLKGARRRMLAGLARAHRGGDESGELKGAVERLLTQRSYDSIRP